MWFVMIYKAVVIAKKRILFHFDSLRIHIKPAAFLILESTRWVNQENHKKSVFFACHLIKSQ